jgi:hypothetical protein
MPRAVRDCGQAPAANRRTIMRKLKLESPQVASPETTAATPNARGTPTRTFKARPPEAAARRKR